MIPGFGSGHVLVAVQVYTVFGSTAVNFFAHLCALRDNCALLSNNKLFQFICRPSLSVKILCLYNLNVPPFGRYQPLKLIFFF